MSIVMEDVSYRYPSPMAFSSRDRDGWALRGVTLTIEPGELVAVLGANGAGKSTLCMTFNGLVPHFFHGDLRGTVRINGVDTRDVAVADLITTVGVLFQNPFDQLTGVTETVHDEVAFGPENLGLPVEETLNHVSRALDAAGVRGLAARHPYSLSGGEQQRVALAAVLAMQPEILVLDEPTSQLDPVGSDEVFDVIRRLHHQGRTIILAEHNVEVLATLATRIVVLDEGCIAMAGSPRAIFTDRELVTHGVFPPPYVALGSALADRGLRPPGNEPLTLPETLTMLTQVMAHGDGRST